MNVKKCIFRQNAFDEVDEAKTPNKLEERQRKEMLLSPLAGNEQQKELRTPEPEIPKWMEPRRIKELAESPLHRKESYAIAYLLNHKKQLKTPQSDTKIKDCKEDVRNIELSEPRRTKEMLQSPLHRVPVKSKLNFKRQKSKRLMMYLKEIPDFEAISNKGLESMSLEDFISIIEHLFRFTNVSVEPLDKSNYIKNIINTMRQLNYLHPLRKSALMMPCASLPHLIPLFDFLLNFVPKDNND